MFSIAVNELYKTYKGALGPTLQGLSFAFPEGKIAGLLGPNGAGKTTTISILCGLVRGDNGEVMIHGKKQDAANRETIKQIIGIVPQQIALYPQLSAVENLTYFGNLYGFKGKPLLQKIMHYLELFGLEKSAHKEIHKYSGGMKRRANIIAAILHDPRLLILDEPTAGVDVQSRSMILQFLREYNRQGASILYTSHLLEEAQSLCEEVVIMDEGKMIVQGNPLRLIAEHPHCRNLEDVFLHFTGQALRD
ncbi:ABC transporter ATP-binding protein [Chitinophaga nivalis]|uniref:ABC transporter ATP-binding protein n=1 Tax=Chitinophaga nivalis TaxID=2991709 RepID=A0ABT3ISG3_9BACT|nr:ABC transporter ATP-binding protein [Chitinophaga nivalis]MCW3463394.1 ABC transporter ATP-binding protein [Chitinophaga nivalis]MCW3486916.1 ABC transporter ATP-binding protein [Chitinophaga nivalis]